MDDQTTTPHQLPSGAEREYMIQIAREALAEWDDWTGGRGRYADVSLPLGGTATSGLATCASWLLRVLGEQPAVTA